MAKVRAAKERYTLRHRTRPALESGPPKALSAPSSRHLSGEAWPREHMHVEHGRSGTEHAGMQVADDQRSSALRYSLPPFSVIVRKVLRLHDDAALDEKLLGDPGRHPAS
jgi:hypothetical protein